MKMNGTRLLPAPQQLVWEKLNDAETLKRCIPGCQSLEQTDPTHLKATVGLKIGPVSAKFKGKMTLLDVQAPDSYKLQFEGQGGVAGFAKGEAQVNLTPEGDATRLSYNVKANIGGKLAQVGARLIDGVAKKIAGQFFAAFNKRASGAGG